MNSTPANFQPGPTLAPSTVSRGMAAAYARCSVNAEPVVWSRYYFDDFGRPQIASPFELTLHRWIRPLLFWLIVLLVVVAGVLVTREAAADDRDVKNLPLLEWSS